MSTSMCTRMTLMMSAASEGEVSKMSITLAAPVRCEE